MPHHVSLQPLPFLAVVFACLALYATSALAEEQELLPNPEGIVAYCFDGDTIKLTDRRVVRLAGIDTPEVRHGQDPAQYFAREARDILDGHVKGQKVLLYAANEPGKDSYGRIIAEARLKDGTSLSEIMIAEGAAFYYPHKDLSPALGTRLLAIQKEAIANRIGMWKHLLALPLARQKYVGNKASLRFFPVDCPEAQRIKPRNKVLFGALMDAFTAGYAPARICLFWPTQP